MVLHWSPWMHTHMYYIAHTRSISTYKLTQVWTPHTCAHIHVTLHWLAIYRGNKVLDIWGRGGKVHLEKGYHQF